MLPLLPFSGEAAPWRELTMCPSNTICPLGLPSYTHTNTPYTPSLQIKFALIHSHTIPTQSQVLTQYNPLLGLNSTDADKPCGH